MFEQLKKLKAIQDVLTAAQNDDVEGAIATLKKNGVPEAEARAAIEKIRSLKKLIAEKAMSGEITKPEQVMEVIRESGIIPPESFDRIMEQMKKREK